MNLTLDDVLFSGFVSKSMSCMIDTKETTNLPQDFCLVFFVLVVMTKGFEGLREITKGD